MDRIPCIVTGIAYSELNGKIEEEMQDETFHLLFPGQTNNNNNNVECAVGHHHVVSHLKTKIYSDPAIRINHRDLMNMKFEGIPILEEHGAHKTTPIGKIEKSWINGAQVNIRASIFDPVVAKKIRTKEYDGFSIGYNFKSHGKRVLEKELKEVSICKTPVFERCRIVQINASANGILSSYTSPAVPSVQETGVLTIQTIDDDNNRGNDNVMDKILSKKPNENKNFMANNKNKYENILKLVGSSRSFEKNHQHPILPTQQHQQQKVWSLLLIYYFSKKK